MDNTPEPRRSKGYSIIVGGFVELQSGGQLSGQDLQGLGPRSLYFALQ